MVEGNSVLQPIHYQTTHAHQENALRPRDILGHPRMAQGALETQRHQRYKATKVAPRARSKMLTSLSHLGSILGHPKIHLWQSLTIFSSLLFQFLCKFQLYKIKLQFIYIN